MGRAMISMVSVRSLVGPVLPVLMLAVLMVASGCRERRSGPLPPGNDTGVTRSDGGPSDTGSGRDGGGGLDSTTPPADSGSGTVTAEYDAEGCLTVASASSICGFSSDGTVCSTLGICEVTSMSQCQIDCEMAVAAEFCITREQVESCIPAARAGICESVSSCINWLYFPDA